MYAPYGEQRLNQQPFAYEERFTFTGKERDIETGYDYSGARNHLSALSIWGAVDPLANKYIYNSPCVYCDGNPIKFVDPDGNYFSLPPISMSWTAAKISMENSSNHKLKTFVYTCLLTETRNRHFAERLFYADNLPQSATACYNGNIAALRIDRKHPLEYIL